MTWFGSSKRTQKPSKTKYPLGKHANNLMAYKIIPRYGIGATPWPNGRTILRRPKNGLILCLAVIKMTNKSGTNGRERFFHIFRFSLLQFVLATTCCCFWRPKGEIMSKMSQLFSAWSQTAKSTVCQVWPTIATTKHKTRTTRISVFYFPMSISMVSFLVSTSCVCCTQKLTVLTCQRKWVA